MPSVHAGMGDWHAPRGWLILPLGVCRTPPIRGKGRAHLS